MYCSIHVTHLVLLFTHTLNCTFIILFIVIDIYSNVQHIHHSYRAGTLCGHYVKHVYYHPATEQTNYNIVYLSTCAHT
jgi:hypothetical protein